jgi:hypothetical protein
MLDLGIALDQQDLLHRHRAHREQGLAERQAIAVAQILLFDLLAIDERAVAAAQIGNRALFVRDDEAGMPARDAGGFENDVAVRRATDECGTDGQRNLLVPLVGFEQQRVVDAPIKWRSGG